MNLHGSTVFTKCYAGGSVKFYCPAQNTDPNQKLMFASQNVDCKVCGMVSPVTDGDVRGNHIYVTVNHGPLQIGSSLDESEIDGYMAFLADSCGKPIDGTPASSWTKSGDSGSCCNEYQYVRGISTSLVRGGVTATKLLILPYKGSNVVEGGVALDITDAGSSGGGGGGGGGGTGQASAGWHAGLNSVLIALFLASTAVIAQVV